MVATVLVEVKWGNTLGENQLIDQWKWISVDGQRRENLRKYSRHVLLSDRPRRYDKQLEEQRARQQEKPKWGSRLVGISWHDVAWNLRAGRHGEDEVETWRRDLFRFLDSQGVVVFDGLQHLRLVEVEPVEWQFDECEEYGIPVLRFTGVLDWTFLEQGEAV